MYRKVIYSPLSRSFSIRAYAGSVLRLVNNSHWKFGELELGLSVVLLILGIFSGPQKQFLSFWNFSPSLRMKGQSDWTWARWKAHTKNMRCNSLVFIFQEYSFSHISKKITLLFVHFGFQKDWKARKLNGAQQKKNWNIISYCLSCSNLSHFLTSLDLVCCTVSSVVWCVVSNWLVKKSVKTLNKI